MSRGSFLDLLAQSPVKPMLEHAMIAGNCTDELGVFIAALNKNDWQGAIKSRERIVELEHEADDLKREIRGTYRKAFFFQYRGLTYWISFGLSIDCLTPRRISPD